VLPCEFQGHKINMLDTPGYADFMGEAMSALKVADSALVPVSASAGVEMGTETTWAELESRKLPRLIFISKLDRENTDFQTTLEQVRQRLGKKCVALQIANGKHPNFKGVIDLLKPPAELPADLAGAAKTLKDQLIEAIAETDDTLATKYLEGQELTRDELLNGLRTGVLSGQIAPVLTGSAVAAVGIKELMEAIVTLLPSPSKSPPVKTAGQNNKDGKELPLKADGPLAVYVFKTTADPYVGKLSYFRVYGATFKGDSQLWNSKRNEPERIGQVFQPRGKEQQPLQEVITGDIGVVSRLSHTRTFDTLCDKAHPVNLAGAELPEPVYGLAVTPKNQVDLDKMANALARLEEEDPTLHVERNADTKETVIWGLGDIHVETAVERIRRKFDCNLATSLPKIAYRETIGGTTTVEYKHKKQSGGHGQYGHVFLRLEPLARGQGVQFFSKVAGGSVPKEYFPAVEKGVRHAAAEGVIAGYPLVDVSVTVTDGSSHSVDSSSMAFEIAGGMALRKGVMEARPQLLEPVLSVTVLVPEENAGAVMGDLNTRRARIHGMEPRGGGLTEINADAPQSTMRRYAADLRSLTQARGTFMTKFAHYDVVPHQEAQKVIEASAKHPVGA